MTSGIDGPWQDQPTWVLARSGAFADKASRERGLIRRRWAMRRRRRVNWRPRSSMRQGAKSKHLEHPVARSKLPADGLLGDAVIANCHKVGPGGQAAVASAMAPG